MSALQFVDSHCHLDRLKPDDRFSNINERLNHTKNAGVSHMLNVCIDFNNYNHVIDIANNNDNVYASVGIHPCGTYDDELKVSDIVEKTYSNKVIAIGETGLDYHYSADKKTSQQQFFRAHIKASNQTNMPLIIHSREARKDTIQIMREENAHSGVMHCFTENWDMAKKALDLGFYISFSGIITFKNASELREVVRKTPLDRTLIETDAPYLAPDPYRGKPNEPLYVKYVAEKLAQIHNLPIEEIADITTRNFFDLFKKASSN